MNDTIYRQMAINAADIIINRDTSGNNDVVKAMTAWKEYIKALPSVQKTGQWLEDKTGCVYWVCSCCGYPSEASCANLFYRFCPRCGSRMEGVE